MWNRILSSSRFLVIIAVLGTLASALSLLIYGALDVVVLVADALREGTVSSKGAKALALGFIEVTDVFLVSVVLVIIASGLYSLFVDDSLSLPAWLEVHDLDDLKAKLISVVVAVLAVLFLGEVVKWDGQRELLGIGGGIALVIAALTFFLSQKPAKKD